MAFGKIKVDDIIYTDANGNETNITVEDLATATNGINTNSGNIATNTTNIASNTSAISAKAPLASPQFTGIPVATGDGTSTDGQIQLNCSQNTHGVKIKSPPHSAGASYTLTLPDTAGTNGFALTTDGSGGLSWVDYLPKSGGTVAGNVVITGNLTGVGDITRTGNISLTGSLGVTGSVDLPGTDPTSDNHAARKAYVDAQVASKASLGVALALG